MLDGIVFFSKKELESDLMDTDQSASWQKIVHVLLTLHHRQWLLTTAGRNTQ